VYSSWQTSLQGSENHKDREAISRKPKEICGFLSRILRDYMFGNSFAKEK